jgi:hypothetical protein
MLFILIKKAATFKRLLDFGIQDKDDDSDKVFPRIKNRKRSRFWARIRFQIRFVS